MAASGLPRYPAAERWAQLVLRACDADDDPRTLGSWAHLAHVSVPRLRAWCYVAGTAPRPSLLLARVLRAHVLAMRAGCAPRHLLDISELRTLRRLDARGACLRDKCDAGSELLLVLAVLGSQTFVTATALLEELERAALKIFSL